MPSPLRVTFGDEPSRPGPRSPAERIKTHRSERVELQYRTEYAGQSLGFTRKQNKTRPQSAVGSGEAYSKGSGSARRPQSAKVVSVEAAEGEIGVAPRRKAASATARRVVEHPHVIGGGRPASGR